LKKKLKKQKTTQANTKQTVGKYYISFSLHFFFCSVFSPFFFCCCMLGNAFVVVIVVCIVVVVVVVMQR